MSKIKHLDWFGLYDRGWGKILLSESYIHPAKVAFKLAERIYDYMLERHWLKPGDIVIDPFSGIGGFAYGAMVRGLRFSGVELEPRYHELGAQEYGCPGFTAETWKRIHYRTNIIKGLRAHSEHLHALMCPCCETALKPKPKLDRQKKFVVEQHIPFREPHHYRGNIPLWNFKYGGFPKWGSGVMYCGDSRRLLEVIAGADAIAGSPPFAQSLANDGRGRDDLKVAGQLEAKV